MSDDYDRIVRARDLLRTKGVPLNKDTLFFCVTESEHVPKGTIIATAEERIPGEDNATYWQRAASKGMTAMIDGIATNDVGPTSLRDSVARLNAKTRQEMRRVHHYGDADRTALAGTFDTNGFWHCVTCGAKLWRYEPAAHRIVLKHREVIVYVPAASAGVEMDCPKCGARNAVMMA